MARFACVKIFILKLYYCFNPNLGGGRGGVNFSFTPCWFSLNNLETVKAVSLAFCGIQEHFISDIRAKFGISNSPQSPDITQNSDGGISDFLNFSKSLIKEHCHNSRTSDDIPVKLGPVTKLDKKNKTTSKKFGHDVMSEDCDVIVIFPIYGQFGVIREPNFGGIVCKTYIFH